MQPRKAVMPNPSPIAQDTSASPKPKLVVVESPQESQQKTSRDRYLEALDRFKNRAIATGSVLALLIAISGMLLLEAVGFIHIWKTEIPQIWKTEVTSGAAPDPRSAATPATAPSEQHHHSSAPPQARNDAPNNQPQTTRIIQPRSRLSIPNPPPKYSSSSRCSAAGAAFL